MLLLVVASVALGSALLACGGDENGSPSPGATVVPAGTTAVSGNITVFAAASLTDAFTDIGAAFEAANPQAKVTFNFAASSALVTQLIEGAPADVYASADGANMDRLVDAGGNAAEPVVVARNTLEIIVAKGNPEHIQSVADLANPRLLVVAASPKVPIGGYAQQVFDNAGVTVKPVSLEENVKAIVAKVTSGEADAGIVYGTDVNAAAGEADGVVIPDELNVVASYPVALTAGGPQRCREPAPSSAT